MSCATSILARSNASLSENSLYVGINLQSILYGIQAGLYFKIMHVFLTRGRKLWRSNAFYAVFSSATLGLITIRVATEILYGERMWLIDRNFPGGPLAYGVAHASDVYMVVGAVAVVILQQMADALMIHRCRIVWDSWGAIVAPLILWLANLALGIMVMWATVAPRFEPMAGNLGLAYAAISVFLNLTLTSMIWYRLVRHVSVAQKYRRGEERAYLGTTDALVVESMLPYTLCGVAMVVTYGAGSEIAIAFSSVYTLAMCVSSQLLVLRVVEGRAWQRNKIGERAEAERLEGGGAVALVHLETLRYETDK